MVNTRQSNATTAPIENGDIKVEQITISNKTPLFVLFSYGGKGAPDFFAAAEYKKERIIKKYPNAEVRIINGFQYIHEFKDEWAQLYLELCDDDDVFANNLNKLSVSMEEKIRVLDSDALTNEQKKILKAEASQLQKNWEKMVLVQKKREAQVKYHLWEVHYFGHGGNEALNFRNFNGKNELTLTDIDRMEVLPWHPNNGIFVLHSCRGAAFEDSFNAEKIKGNICLAQHISLKQHTRCLGQVVYGNFSSLSLDAADGYFYSKTEQLKYRENRYTNKVGMALWFDRVLWGYALLTGETGEKILKNKGKYETSKSIQNDSELSKKYPIYQEVKMLVDKNQILPCRVFNNGQLETERIVAVDIFNHNDLEYI